MADKGGKGALSAPAPKGRQGFENILQIRVFEESVAKELKHLKITQNYQMNPSHVLVITGTVRATSVPTRPRRLLARSWSFRARATRPNIRRTVCRHMIGLYTRIWTTPLLPDSLTLVLRPGFAQPAHRCQARAVPSTSAIGLPCEERLPCINWV